MGISTSKSKLYEFHLILKYKIHYFYCNYIPIIPLEGEIEIDECYIGGRITVVGLIRIIVFYWDSYLALMAI
jgi:hypothetical protein